MPEAGVAAPTGYRSPFRFDDDDLLVVDQRRLPDALVELPVRSAPEGAQAIRDQVVRGGPAIGQVAALALALTARSVRLAQPYARRAILFGATNALRNTRTTPVSLGRAMDRMMTRYRDAGELSEDGEAIAAALWDEAMALVAEATAAHGRIADAGLAFLSWPADRPLQVLTHGNTGPLSSGQFGTALGIVQAAHHAERPIHVWVAESRPDLAGARLTAWELGQSGVEHTLLADGAAASIMADGRVDLVLVGADRIAANGDTASDVGTYPLAVLAARHGVPLHVVAPLATVDLATADGASIPIEGRAAEDVAAVRGIRMAPLGTHVFNPASDVTPADLVTAFITDAGVLRPPYAASLRAAVEARPGPGVAGAEAGAEAGTGAGAGAGAA
ncbi:MAG: S-methyl-5-thioribose-1-phosphate isomerase [Chloroflexi bacterium]|nr:S-methyl-5-thioribose-1-phosphate isomerase [Chloroflexota bacterium]